VSSYDQQIQADQVSKAGVHTLYSWHHIAAVPASLKFGPKDDSSGAPTTWLIDHPGAWVCDLLTEAKPIREFRFTVNAQGMIDSDAMQTGAGAVPLFDEVSLIDLRIPKGSTFDQRVRPAAIKKSRGFGLPWPKHDNVKAIVGAAPPASGLADPK
jgi:hypothetical protein